MKRLPTTVKVSHSKVPKNTLLKLCDLGRRQKRETRKEGKRKKKTAYLLSEKEQQGGIKALDESTDTKAQVTDRTGSSHI